LRNRRSQVTNHAQILSILEYKHPGINEEMAKCVSTQLKPLTVVYLDEYGQMKTKDYQDMIVQDCGCR
jgi:growth differentiation factor 6